jgi:hypothetical protein
MKTYKKHQHEWSRKIYVFKGKRWEDRRIYVTDSQLLKQNQDEGLSYALFKAGIVHIISSLKSASISDFDQCALKIVPLCKKKYKSSPSLSYRLYVKHNLVWKHLHTQFWNFIQFSQKITATVGQCKKINRCICFITKFSESQKGIIIETWSNHLE